MTHAEKYIFDLNGFFVVRNAFDTSMVARANEAIDAYAEEMHERTGKLRTSGLYGRESTPLAGDGTTGRKDVGGMLGWAAPHREPFRELLCHPTVARVLTTLLGVGYRCRRAHTNTKRARMHCLAHKLYLSLTHH